MDGIEEDDGYSDDDLDALPVQAFQELQQDAIRSTQQPRALGKDPLPYVNRDGATNGRLGAFEKLSIDHQGNSYAHQPSSDYGDFDDEMLDGEIFDAAEEPSILPEESNTVRVLGESTQREQWMQQGYGDPSAGTRLQNLHAVSVGRSGTQAPRFAQHGGREPGALLSSPEQRDQIPIKPVKSPAISESLQAKIDEVRIILATPRL